MNQQLRTTDLADLPPPRTAPGAIDARPPLELRVLLRILWQRKWVAMLCLGLALGTAWVLLGRIPPRYTASAEVMLNNRQTTVVDIERVVGDLGGHDMSANEQRVLTSERLLQRVVDRLRLDRDPEFNEALRPSSPVARWQADLGAMLAAGPLGGLLAADAVPDDAATGATHERLGVVEAFRAALDVRGVPFTRSITISVTSTDPAKAALIANTLADLYIVNQLETKFDATRRASAWLNERIGELKRRVERSEAAVETFKAEQSIGNGQGSDLTAQQIAELNTELVSARAARAAAEARFDQVQRRAREGGPGAAAKIVSSELILTLRTRLAEMERRAAELSTRYGERHPRIIDVRAEIADARSAIGAEAHKIVENLRNDVAVARAREVAMEQSLAELEVKSVAFSRSSVALRQLEREATADRKIYESFLVRFRETTEQEDLQAADASILSAAAPPLKPSAPNRRKVLLITGAAGLALGLGLIVLTESLANTFRAASELAERTGLPVLATLPLQGRRRRRSKVLDYVRARPNSTLAEAARGLRTALLLSNVDQPPRVVMVTSSVPGEGKSTSCLLLAHMSHQMNRRAIIVDCDIRRPTLHTSFDLPRTAGLVAVLGGTAELNEAIVTDKATGLDLLPSTQAVPQAADILSSERFARLIDVLRAHYDLVILDTPPVLLVSDAAALGPLADAAIYAVRWNRTPRDAVMQGLARLGDIGVRIAGCLLTLADPAREARHGYARYGDGYGYYAGGRTYYVN